MSDRVLAWDEGFDDQNGGRRARATSALSEPAGCIEKVRSAPESGHERTPLQSLADMG